jgi:dTDP-4-amino-4,6-dideoxygalactose transaminase
LHNRTNLTIFEQNLESYLGAGHIAVLNSGTAAIHLGLILLGVKSGDEVICQSMTFRLQPILFYIWGDTCFYRQ